MIEDYFKEVRKQYQKIEQKRKEREKEQNTALEKRLKEDERARQRREELRIQKLSASGNNLLEYAIDRLIEFAFIKDGKFQIEFYKLGFEETGEGRSCCIAFLNKLQNYGCFNFSRCMDNETISFWNCGIEKLKEYRQKLDIGNKKPVNYPKTNNNKIIFYPEDGVAIYKTADYKFSKNKKTFVLLDFFNNNKNSCFNVEDIKKYCNKHIAIEKHKFKDKKDINDTIREIKAHLKVGKGEFFPILYGGKGWKWLEK